jgi:hypothetical protein
MSANRVRIVAIPSGEAPLEIRKQWVGLELPLMPGRSDAYQLACRGLLSGQELPEPMIGYLVSANDAVHILESKSPDAALWWRTFASSYVSPGKALMFDEYVCEPIEDNPA